MKILIYGINFAPELTGTGKYTGEMAAWLARRGHDVRVVTAPPYYPGWSVADGHRSDRYLLQQYLGVRVRRVPLYVPSRPGSLRRLLHLASFALTSFPAILKQVIWRPDVVWTVQPTLFCAPAALLLARLTGAKAWMHIQDFEIDAGFKLGMLEGALLGRIALSIESFLLRQFDQVSSISDAMVERARKKGARDPVEQCPNWVDIETIRPLNRPSEYRKNLGIDDDAIVLLYSGNMGAKQGLNVVAEAASRVADDRRLVFVFCGDGSYRQALLAQCESLGNVRFLHLQPADRLNELLNVADIHLLPQRGGASDLMLPSKLTGMLASGRPIIATAVEGSSLARAVGACGITVPPDDVDALVQAIRALANDEQHRTELGTRARDQARSLSKDEILSSFETRLHALVQRNILPTSSPSAVHVEATPTHDQS